MKFLLLSMLFFFANCKENDSIKNEHFLGSWEYSSMNNKDEFQNKTFRLTLSKDKKNMIIGAYCSIARGGRRIDCFNGIEQNIIGKIKNDTLYINFKSSWENSKGKAKLYFDKNSKLIWELGECEGELYLPIKIVLEKDIKNSK